MREVMDCDAGARWVEAFLDEADDIYLYPSQRVLSSDIRQFARAAALFDCEMTLLTLPKAIFTAKFGRRNSSRATFCLAFGEAVGATCRQTQAKLAFVGDRYGHP
ncbi:hypothetical protein ON010_g11834 [Phytophthora cinnamomi]|nr:hypothetical protein ON010_g11834 [Phytophthora cinnamomi]